MSKKERVPMLGSKFTKQQAHDRVIHHARKALAGAKALLSDHNKAWRDDDKHQRLNARQLDAVIGIQHSLYEALEYLERDTGV
jgi:hypothetical protein